MQEFHIDSSMLCRWLKARDSFESSLSKPVINIELVALVVMLLILILSLSYTDGLSINSRRIDYQTSVT
jgi:hypothetical protein